VPFAETSLSLSFDAYPSMHPARNNVMRSIERFKRQALVPARAVKS
jgi:hypothetical protein